MDTKLIIFVILGTLLVSAIYSYSSSIFFVSAVTTVCTGTSKTTTTCSVEENDKSVTQWDCKLNKDGKTWSCKQAKTMTGGSIPPELTDALVVATEDTQNETKVLKEPAFNDGLTTSPGAR